MVKSFNCAASLTGAIRTEASQELKANVSLHAHRAGVDLKYVGATLKNRKKISFYERKGN